MNPKTLLIALMLTSLAAIPTIYALEGSGDSNEKSKPVKTSFIEITTQKIFDSLVALAKKEGKPVLVDFTGSDWCSWCVKLHKEVFDTKIFAKKAPAIVHLASVDWPKKRKLPADELTFKKSLMKKFKIKGFPTVLLIDGSGKVIARTGYKKGGAANYIKHLKTLIDAAADSEVEDAPAPPEGSG